MSDHQSLSPLALLPLIGRPDAPVLVDVCIPEDVAADPFTLPGAQKAAHTDLPGLKAQLGGRAAVVICQKGLKLSQGVAAWLRAEGLDARYLQGGMYGWRETPGALRVPVAALPAQPLWVCADRPGIDALAACWCVLRFLQPQARVLFVDPDALAGVAERFGAAPVPTRSASARAFGLDCPILARVAAMAAPCQPVVDGLTLTHPDDTALLTATLPIFDALYRAAQAEAGL